jgi:Mn-containing catalase
MFLRIDRLQIELPRPTKADPNSAAALQELLGGKFGGMSTLNNYFFQSFHFRNKGKLKPFYSLVASITVEEFGHVELVTNGVKLVARGPDLDPATYDVTAGAVRGNPRRSEHGQLLHGGGAALPADSMGTPWSGNYVFSTGNLILDLLHNLFLECGARIAKLRVYETVNDPVRARSAGI